jgi:hypothetical protein
MQMKTAKYHVAMCPWTDEMTIFDTETGSSYDEYRASKLMNSMHRRIIQLELQAKILRAGNINED